MASGDQFEPKPWWYVPPQTFTAVPPSIFGLSDADVERIARRVAELLREASPCTSASAPSSSS